MSEIFAEYRRLRIAREEAEATGRALKKQEDVLKAQIIATMVQGGQTEMHRVKLNTRTKLEVTDWPTLYKYIKENDAFDLLHKRLNESAAKLRLADDIALPVTEEEDYTLELTKE